MNKRLNINFSYFDYIIIALSLLALLFSWLYIILYYFDLPDTIATHFNASGQPDGYSSKTSIWIAPILFTLLSISFIYAAKNPKLLDFSNKIKSIKDEIFSSKTLLLTALLLSSILIIIVYSMIETSLNQSITTSWMILTIMTITITHLIVVFYYYIQSKR